MYGLISGCYGEFFSAREYGLLFLGLEGAGKTTLLECLKSKYGGGASLTPDKIVSTVKREERESVCVYCVLIVCVCVCVGGEKRREFHRSFKRFHRLDVMSVESV